MPDKLIDVCFSAIPEHNDFVWANKQVCLTGTFLCAPGNMRRVDAMAKKLHDLEVDVTEIWKKTIDILVVGGKARIITFKIKQAIEKSIPIFKEQELLFKLNN